MSKKVNAIGGVIPRGVEITRNLAFTYFDMTYFQLTVSL